MKARRYILLCVVLATLLDGSCAKIQGPEEEEWKDLDGMVPISFSTQLVGEETKTSSPLPTSTNFCVFAFYQPGVIGGDAGEWSPLLWTPNFMYNQQVTYNNVAGKWTYSPVKYWPNNAENTITFWAYSPSYNSGLDLIEANHTSNYQYGTTVPGLPDIQFTSDCTRDLLISDLAEDLSYRGGDPSTVSLTFHHAMCWVDFTVTKVDPEGKYDMYLQSIEIVDFFGTAIYRQSDARWLSPSGARESITVYPWQVGDTDVELSHTVAKDFPPKVEGVPVRQIMPIPQSLQTVAGVSPKIRVVYAFKLKTDGGDPATAPAAEFPLGSIPGHIRWDKEAHYTYNLHISPGLPLLFTASVTPWATEQNGYFNVYE